MVVLLSISFVGFINDKWTGPVYFCVALSTSCLVYAREIVISYLNEQPQTAKALALILGLELIILWASWRYFRKRRLLFQPDCPYLTLEEQAQISKEAELAADVRAKRAADPFGQKRRTARPSASAEAEKSGAAEPADGAEKTAEKDNGQE